MNFGKLISITGFVICMIISVIVFSDFNNPDNYMYAKTENTIFIDEYYTKTTNDNLKFERYCIDGELLRLRDSTIVQLQDVTNVKSNQYRTLENGIPVFMYVNNENEYILFLEMMLLLCISANIVAIIFAFKE